MSATVPHRARKRFGQNFLHDPAIIERIINAIGPQAKDHMIEIGPGLGALTLPLLERTGRLEVIEIDRDIIPRLQALCTGKAELVIHQADVLNFDFNTIDRGPAGLRIVGNLPYNISSPLLFHLLDYAPLIRDMHFMLQKEVVDRMAARPGEKAYGRLSASLAAHVQCEYLFRVRSGAFNPPPRVDSAVVRLTPTTPEFSIDSQSRYRQVLNKAFSARRKTLANALKTLCHRALIEQAGIDPGIRAERVTPAQFASLSNLIHAQSTDEQR